MDKVLDWKDLRIKEINSMGYKADPDHPNYDEVQAIYKSEHTSYMEFAREFFGELNKEVLN
jgi:hypothetical protein